MIRRRRKPREIPFSFDSFLDIVANVVGIIIRLILVVWVGARSYASVQDLARTEEKTDAVVEKPLPTDPAQSALERERQTLVELQRRLLGQIRELQSAEAETQVLTSNLVELDSRLRQQSQEQQRTATKLRTFASDSQAIALSREELRARSIRLAAAIRELERQPSPSKTLRYRTPVSRPVQSEELFFECRRGRVAFIDIAAMLNEVRENMEAKGKLLRQQWQVDDVTAAAGPFRLRYTVERERGLLDALGSPGGPDAGGNFRYGVSQWQIEPLTPERGETLDAALAAGSEFRQVIESIDPRETTITFWVYPDSFAIFRRLRDYLYERDATVAGRPLPDGIPIMSTRRGTISRGQ